MTTPPVPHSRRQRQPGQSGNPSGRPRGARALWSERALNALAENCREHGPNEGRPLGLTKFEHANGKITYRVDFEGAAANLTATQLLSHARFRNAVFKQTFRLVAPMQREDWRALLNTLAARMTIVNC